jgi:hypothetical protein
MKEKKIEVDTKTQEILKLYVMGEPDAVKDPMIRELCVDRKKHQQRINGYSETLKAYMAKLQKMAAKMQVDISDAQGAIKYVDSKIVQRHNELTNNP